MLLVFLVVVFVVLFKDSGLGRGKTVGIFLGWDRGVKRGNESERG